jgi:hypothetical protein
MARIQFGWCLVRPIFTHETAIRISLETIPPLLMAAIRWIVAGALPEDGDVIYVLAEDNCGQYDLPFPVVFRDDCWWNAQTAQKLDAYVAAWRPLE